ncbi:WG repeat-containing protein [Niabella beijingensis]|uniref:WG repeat-containing protein n=1 Tax=Niabella beijingensis TaxID=2872700 RepID=UPI001CBABBF3|nr:WG repeat-containing protein [Niabella beijingensis]MBZ4191780.1 WG repeat-containing protein [Niabella beijingensis]
MKAITIFLFSLLMIPDSKAQQYDDYVEAFDNKSNTAIIEEFKTFKETLERLEKMESLFKQDAPRVIDPKEETLMPGYHFDAAAGSNALKQALATPRTFKQTITREGSEIAFDRNHDAPEMRGAAFEITTKVNKVYFYDGTTANGDALAVDYNFSETWPYRKRIDSIEVTENLKAVSGFDEIVLTAQQPAATYQNKKIQIDRIDRNTIWFTSDNTIAPEFYEGLNKAGKVIDSKSSSSGTYKPEQYKTVFAPLKAPLATLIENAIKDSTLDNAIFKEKYKKEAEQLVKNIPRSDMRYYTAQYKGMINGVRLFIKKNSEEKSGTRSFRNGYIAAIHASSQGDTTFFYDNAGKELARFNQPLTAINDYYYEDDQAYYYLAPSKPSLEKLPYYSLEKINGSYVSAREDENTPFLLLNNQQQQLGTFDFVTGSDRVVAAEKSDGSVLIAGPEGVRNTIKDVTRLSAFINDAAVIKIKDNYGFLDGDGKLTIPAVYEEVKGFSDMTTYTGQDRLFAVKKNKKWGLVDRDNNTVIPFAYEDVEPFSFGITMAKKDGHWGLIDTKNAVIVPFDNGPSYSLSTNFGKRTYGLGGGTFNHLGKKEKK